MDNVQAYYDKLWVKLSVGLRAQASSRLFQAQARDIGVNVLRAAGSFKQFQGQLRRENGRRFAETVKMQAYHLEQVKALPLGRDVKLLPSAERLALPFPWHFIQLGLYRMQIRDSLADQDRELQAAIKAHCSSLQHQCRQAEAKEHYKSILEGQGHPSHPEDFASYLDHICARQARRDGHMGDKSSSFRPSDVFNPFKWIVAMFSDHKGGDS